MVPSGKIKVTVPVPEARAPPYPVMMLTRYPLFLPTMLESVRWTTAFEMRLAPMANLAESTRASSLVVDMPRL
jgi:hypothetical protein